MKSLLAAGLGVLMVAGAMPPVGRAQASLDSAEPPAERETASDPFGVATAVSGYRVRGITADVVSLVLDQPAGGGLALETLAVPVGRSTEDASAEDGSGRVRVALLVEIAGGPFLEQARLDDGQTARLELYAYAFKGGRTVAGYLANVFVIDVGELGEAIWQSGLKLYADFDLEPGDYTVRVLARHHQSTVFGLVETPLVVPAGELVAGPLLAGPVNRDGWLPMRFAIDPATPRRPYPFALAGRVLEPAARPVLMAGQEVEAVVLTGPARTPKGKVEILRPGGTKKVAELRIRPGESAPMAWGTTRAWPVALRIPDTLEPGSYVLSLEGGLQPVLVIDASSQSRDILWSDLLSSIGSGALAAAPPPASSARARGGKQLGKLAAGYRTVLQRWSGDWGSLPTEAVMELEQEVLVSSGREVVDQLRLAELAVADELARADVESVIPLIALHEAVLPLYSRRRFYALSAHTRALVDSLAGLYLERGGAPRVVAPALTRVGALLQLDHLVSSGAYFFSRALELDPEDRHALLGLAVSAEKFGDRDRAVDLLQRLVAAHPENGEGALRLAVNLQRTGRPQAAELFERVLAQPSPPWIRALAYEELARIRLTTGGLDPAADLLETACRELPGRSGLVLLLAHLRDRQGRPLDGFDLVGGVAPVDLASGSPRRRYDAWPPHLAEDTEAALAEATRQRIGALERSWAAAEGGR